MRFDVYPGTAIAKSRVAGAARADRRLAAAAGLLRPRCACRPPRSRDSPAARRRSVSTSRSTTPTARPAATTPTSRLPSRSSFSDRKDLLDDFLQTVHLAKSDIALDRLADLDPDRKGKERMVAGGTVIGILTDRFAYVTMPARLLKIELLPLGRRGQQIIAATVRQTDAASHGSRDVLMLWTVWSGQLQPLKTIEIRKALGGNVLASATRSTRASSAAARARGRLHEGHLQRGARRRRRAHSRALGRQARGLRARRRRSGEEALSPLPEFPTRPLPRAHDLAARLLDSRKPATPHDHFARDLLVRFEDACALAGLDRVLAELPPDFEDDPPVRRRGARRAARRGRSRRRRSGNARPGKVADCVLAALGLTLADEPDRTIAIDAAVRATIAAAIAKVIEPGSRCWRCARRSSRTRAAPATRPTSRCSRRSPRSSTSAPCAWSSSRRCRSMRRRRCSAPPLDRGARGGARPRGDRCARLGKGGARRRGRRGCGAD